MNTVTNVGSAHTDAATRTGHGGAPQHRATLLLGAAAFAGLLLEAPYVTQLSGGGTRPTWVALGIWAVAQAIVLGLAARVAVGAARRAGIALTPIAGWSATARDFVRIRSALALGVGMGAACGAALVALTALAPRPTVLHSVPDSSLANRFLASVGAGMYEEVLFRVLAVSLFVWLGTRIARRLPPTRALMWTGIILAALAFGAAHIAPAARFYVLSPAGIAVVMAGNGLLGACCGWLFWRQGIVAAMLAHAMADIVLKVITPMLT